MVLALDEVKWEPMSDRCSGWGYLLLCQFELEIMMGVSVSMYLPETLTIIWLSRQTLSEDQLSNAGV
jgi:hypothetical protein